MMMILQNWFFDNLSINWWLTIAVKYSRNYRNLEYSIHYFILQLKSFPEDRRARLGRFFINKLKQTERSSLGEATQLTHWHWYCCPRLRCSVGILRRQKIVDDGNPHGFFSKKRKAAESRFRILVETCWLQICWLCSYWLQTVDMS